MPEMEVYHNMPVVAAGFGKTKTFGDSSEYLQKAEGHILPPRECTLKTGYTVLNHQFCMVPDTTDPFTGKFGVGGTCEVSVLLCGSEILSEFFITFMEQLSSHPFK